MRSDDFQRRRLRNIYERNASRVRAVADARDRRGSGGNDGGDVAPAPRRFIISAQRTRMEGFGRGGLQVFKSRRSGRSDTLDQRFADRTIFRRGGRGRFQRDDDVARKEGRDRAFSRTFRGGNAPRDGNKPRFGRLRQQARTRINARQKPRDLNEEIERYRRNGPEPTRNNNNNNNKRNNGKPGQNAPNNNNNPKNRAKDQAARKPVTKEDLDAQLDNFRNA